jgi:hypothetical protein
MVDLRRKVIDSDSVNDMFESSKVHVLHSLQSLAINERAVG